MRKRADMQEEIKAKQDRILIMLERLSAKVDKLTTIFENRADAPDSIRQDYVFDAKELLSEYLFGEDKTKRSK